MAEAAAATTTNKAIKIRNIRAYTARPRFWLFSTCCRLGRTHYEQPRRDGQAQSDTARPTRQPVWDGINMVHDSEGAGDFVSKGHGARGLFVDIEAALFYRNRQPPRRSFLTLTRLGDKRMGKSVLRVAFCLTLLLALCIGARAQTQITTGVIQGTVLDESGAVLPAANIEVKNPDTNFTRNLTADSAGRFVFLQLQPGRYLLTVSKQGFATLVQENLDLTVGQTISLNLNMKVSRLEEKITITAAPTIDTVKTESSSTLNERAVGNLPILGRKFEDLLTLTPGVSITQGPDGDEINFAGQRGIFNNISLDGGDYNNGFFGEQAGGQRAAMDIPLDAIKEFQVIATGASAEFGRTA